MEKALHRLHQNTTGILQPSLASILKADIEALEKVQRRATMAHSLKGLTYELRLKKLTTLSVRRTRGDLITQ